MVSSSRRTSLNSILFYSLGHFCRLVADSYLKKLCNNVRQTLKNKPVFLLFSFRAIIIIPLTMQFFFHVLPKINHDSPGSSGFLLEHPTVTSSLTLTLNCVSQGNHSVKFLFFVVGPLRGGEGRLNPLNLSGPTTKTPT